MRLRDDRGQLAAESIEEPAEKLRFTPISSRVMVNKTFRFQKVNHGLRPMRLLQDEYALSALVASERPDYLPGTPKLAHTQIQSKDKRNGRI